MRGGWFNPLVRRSPAISHRVILWSQNFLTLSINIPSTRQLSLFFLLFWQVFQKFSQDRQDILMFEIKNCEINFFFNFFSTKVSNFVSNLNDHYSQLSFEVYNVFVPQKLPISRFLIYFFSSGPWTLWRPPEAAISTSATSIGYQIWAKDLSFYMILCLLL